MLNKFSIKFVINITSIDTSFSPAFHQPTYTDM